MGKFYFCPNCRVLFLEDTTEVKLLELSLSLATQQYKCPSCWVYFDESDYEKNSSRNTPYSLSKNYKAIGREKNVEVAIKKLIGELLVKGYNNVNIQAITKFSQSQLDRIITPALKATITREYSTISFETFYDTDLREGAQRYEDFLASSVRGRKEVPTRAIDKMLMYGFTHKDIKVLLKTSERAINAVKQVNPEAYQDRMKMQQVHIAGTMIRYIAQTENGKLREENFRCNTDAAEAYKKKQKTKRKRQNNMRKKKNASRQAIFIDNTMKKHSAEIQRKQELKAAKEVEKRAEGDDST